MEIHNPIEDDKLRKSQNSRQKTKVAFGNLSVVAHYRRLFYFTLLLIFLVIRFLYCICRKCVIHSSPIDFETALYLWGPHFLCKGLGFFSFYYRRIPCIFDILSTAKDSNNLESGLLRLLFDRLLTLIYPEKVSSLEERARQKLITLQVIKTHLLLSSIFFFFSVVVLFYP